MASKSRTVRICNELADIIYKIQNKMETDGVWNPSTSAASKELYDRIIRAGGLKS